MGYLFNLVLYCLMGWLQIEFYLRILKNWKRDTVAALNIVSSWTNAVGAWFMGKKLYLLALHNLWMQETIMCFS